MPTARAADLLLIGGQGDDVSVAAAAIRMQNWKSWEVGTLGLRPGGRMAGGCMGCVVVHGNRSTGGRWKFHLGAQSATDLRAALIDVCGVRLWAPPALRFKNRYGSQLRLRVPVRRVPRDRRGPRFTTALLVGCASPACLEWQHQKSERRNHLCASVNAISFLASNNPIDTLHRALLCTDYYLSALGVKYPDFWLHRATRARAWRTKLVSPFATQDR